MCFSFLKFLFFSLIFFLKKSMKMTKNKMMIDVYKFNCCFLMNA